MAIVKAKYLEALDKDTNQIVQVQMIPPEPEGSDLGGVTKEEKQKIAMDYIPTDGFYDAVEDGAGSHNSFFRGKNLGTQVTAQQYARMVDGTFKDLFIGDYWTLNETSILLSANFSISAFVVFSTNTNSLTNICFALFNIFFSPVDKPFSFCLKLKFLTTSATS